MISFLWQGAAYELRSTAMLLRSLFFSLCLTLPSLALAASAGRPNIILFLVDDMGWRDCGAYGSNYYETPRIDAFARQSMRFTHAYAQPLCSPTRASLLTGQYSARHGITSATGHQPPQAEGFRYLPEKAPEDQPMLTPTSKNYLDPKNYTLVRALKEVGYRTAHIGKWHLGLTAPHWPEQHGFDVAFHCHPDPGPPGNYFSPYGVLSEGEPRVQTRVGTITDGPPGEYIVDRLADEAIRFIESSKDTPFFLNLWQYGVHGPWGHKESYTQQFKNKPAADGQGNPIMASMLKSVDESFGRILDALDKNGLAENTIVVFNSDNGGNTHSNIASDAKTKKKQAKKGASPQLDDWQRWAGNQPPTNNTPLRDGKGTLYEGGVRVPLMWRWPNHISASGTNDTVVGHIDLLPTLLDILGLKPKEGAVLDGVSYAPVVLGEGGLKREAFFNYFPHGNAGRGGVTVVSGGLKLIRWFSIDPNGPDRFELYDLQADPGEASNLAASRVADVKRLDLLMDGFLQRTGANFPRPNPAYAPNSASGKSNRPLQGWVPKSVDAKHADGSLQISANGKNGFMAMTNLDLAGPITLQVTSEGQTGTLRAQWRLVTQEAFPEGDQQAQATEIAPGISSIKLPVDGSLRHIRLHFPMPIRVKRIALIPSSGPGRVWEF
jgi:arylsulfatase A-like enzyme